MTRHRTNLPKEPVDNKPDDSLLDAIKKYLQRESKPAQRSDPKLNVSVEPEKGSVFITREGKYYEKMRIQTRGDGSYIVDYTTPEGRQLLVDSLHPGNDDISHSLLLTGDEILYNFGIKHKEPKPEDTLSPTVNHLARRNGVSSPKA